MDMTSQVEATIAAACHVTPKYIADLFADGGMRCSCALESWEPTITGHQKRCMIHIVANALYEKYQQNKGGKA